MSQSVHTAIVAVVLLVAGGSRPLHAGSPVYVGLWTAESQLVSMDRIDHSAWHECLCKYVDGDGMVAYRDLHASSIELRALDDYLKTLSTASITIPASRDARLAFWINAYNAVTVRGILREYPTTSIRNHTARVWGYNIWKDLQLYVGGRPYSLDHIEHEILRKKGEPRIHFAIVCASIGCPRLLNEAYVGNRIQEQLDRNTRDFFSRAQNFRHDERNRRFYLSSILDWFGEDFGTNQPERLRALSQWLPNEAARQAALHNAVSVSFLDYDWNLNEQPGSSTMRR